MLTKLTIKNFKRFENVEIELGDPVVFIGPNNSGKTTALQALTLWEVGLKRCIGKRKGKRGVAINRRDPFAIPVPEAKLFWRRLRVRNVQRIGGNLVTKNIRIDIIVEGITEDKAWKCGLEFDYANEESFYCRPLRIAENKNADRMSIPPEAGKVQIAFLPPMSGLAANELRLDPGAINVRIGEGRTAEILRNLCYKIYEESNDQWGKLVNQIHSLFGAELEAPEYFELRGEIVMYYKELGTKLDLISAGRGFHQTLFLLAYMYANPGTVLLLDEPDAHLEIIRQCQIYRLLTDVAQENGNQIVMASHSEVLLNEAAEKDVVVAFVGKPHRINDRGNQLRKSLKGIGFDHYYQAEQMGWVLYLEGSTDLAILQVFAERLEHKEARQVLDRPFVYYVANQPNEVCKHFYGLRDAISHLKGIAIFDHLEQELPHGFDGDKLKGLMWKQREIENYLCDPETLEVYARATKNTPGPLFTPLESDRRIKTMKESIREIEQALKTLRKISPWDDDTKVSDDFLTPLFEVYFQKLGLYNIIAKKNFHELARLVPKEKIDPEIKQKLDAIVKVARSAKPRVED